MSSARSPAQAKYDVVIAGARCAGASTAMLLARRGLRVLVVDPVPRGRDTLSTHALMRGAVLQLRRWGLLDAIRAAGTPAIRSTTFHYGEETIEIPIKARDGVDTLCAPRRTVLDPVLIDAALAAGAEVVHGRAVVDVLRDARGRVHGVKLGARDTGAIEVEADLVIGADGIRSRVARLVNAPVDYTVRHMSSSIYGYWRGVALQGYHWFYDIGVSVGSIPTNEGQTCVFVLLPQPRFEKELHRGMETLYHDALEAVSPELAGCVAESDGPGRLRAFAGARGFLRRAVGPGWALVGDAGYFRDPITAHGITDALHDADMMSRAVAGNDTAMASFQAARDERVRGLLDVTTRISSFEWSLDEVKAYHLDLNREMNAQIEAVQDHSLA